MSIRIAKDGKGIDLNVSVPSPSGQVGFSTRDADLDISISVLGLAWLTFTRGETVVSVILSDAQRNALIETLSLVPERARALTDESDRMSGVWAAEAAK